MFLYRVYQSDCSALLIRYRVASSPVSRPSFDLSSAREFGLQARVITGDELGLELWISISPCLFRPTRALAFAFKHGPSLRFERNLAHFLKRVFVLAFKFTFTLKLIPFFFKSNLGLRLKLLLVLKRALSRTTPTR
ncbi:hypothetical protein GGG16DRAFT_117207 [Schizophyllum commune]